MTAVAIVLACLAGVAMCQDTTSWTGPIFGQPAPEPTTSWTGPIFGQPSTAPATVAPTTQAPATTTSAAPSTTTLFVDPVCLKCVKYLCNGFFGFTQFLPADRRIPVCTQQLYNVPCEAIANNITPSNLRDRIRLGFVKACIRYVKDYSN